MRNSTETSQQAKSTSLASATVSAASLPVMSQWPRIHTSLWFNLMPMSDASNWLFSIMPIYVKKPHSEKTATKRPEGVASWIPTTSHGFDAFDRIGLISVLNDYCNAINSLEFQTGLFAQYTSSGSGMKNQFRALYSFSILKDVRVLGIGTQTSWSRRASLSCSLTQPNLA